MGNRNSQAKFKVEHTLDEMYTVRDMKELSRDSSISTISQLNLVDNEVTEHPTSLMESASEKKGRLRSHWIVYLTMLNVSIGFSIVLTGVYPYLKLLLDDPNVSKIRSGIVIACNPLGQLIAAPIAGWAGNKLGGIRYVCYVTMTCFALGSLLYGMLPALDEVWENSAFHLMLLARFVVGLSSSNVTLCRSYIAQSTTLQERTKAISLVSASQALGFIIGPALQVIMNLAIESDMGKYRSTGFIAAIMAVGNIFLLTPFIFQEYDIGRKEREMLAKAAPGKTATKLPKIDYLALIGILFGFFLVQFVFVLVESLMEPLVLDQYSWCDNMAVIVVGLCLMISGVLTITMFVMAPKLARQVGERNVLLLCGFGICIVGLFLFMPWGPQTLDYCPEEEHTTTFLPTTTLESILHDEMDYDEYAEMSFVFGSTSTFGPDVTDDYEERSDLFYKLCSNVTHCLGCPPKQEWCIDSPQLALPQFFIAFFVLISGYPFGVAMSNAIFSKIIGPRPQGTWMGILTSTGSFARVLGPIFVSSVYVKYGTRITFGVLVIAMFVGVLELCLLYRRLVPMKVIVEPDGKRF